ncbi:hypothetical protein PRZ48_012052 [Zasmidium cellare]|uniref:Amine oxidase n=1 Tax=Zasmidium cellare TaxID=395010 RepID=A0ABR0E488_ZASCE|nr:hypothetical protein PRZ48_012052 [Zasmidium cellare]
MDKLLLTLFSLIGTSAAAPLACEKTDVLILGAGSAGISAAKALSNQNITNFIILEYNKDIGGRVKHTNFGQKPDGSGPYVIEQGANWIHEIGENDGKSEPMNPIYQLALQDNLDVSQFTEKNITGFDDSGDYFNVSQLSDEFYQALDRAYEPIFPGEDTGEKDISIRGALSRAGWNSERDHLAQAAEVFGFDFDYAVDPEVVTTFGPSGDTKDPYSGSGGPDVFVRDQRGYNFILKQQLRSFLKYGDPRLRLNTTVTKISTSNSSVTVTTEDSHCFQAKHSISTFSVGVLQNAALKPHKAPVRFVPELPAWKQDAISGFGMGIYTKIFFQFNASEIFWPLDVENIIYASPTQRAYYNTWQSLTLEHYFPGSGLIFATMYTQDALKVEAQSDEETKEEALDVLRRMFGDGNVTEPLDFMYPRWGMEPWAYGSYSYWPVGFTAQQHENLRANVGRLWFAGEALASRHQQSTVHGAWLTACFQKQRISYGINQLIDQGDRDPRSLKVYPCFAPQPDLTYITPHSHQNPSYTNSLASVTVPAECPRNGKHVRDARCEDSVVIARSLASDAFKREWAVNAVASGWAVTIHEYIETITGPGLRESPITPPIMPPPNPTLDTHSRLLKLLSSLQQLLPPKQSILQLVDFHGHSLQWYHGSMSSRSFRQELCSAPQSIDSIYLRGLDLQWCALLFATLAASLTIASEPTVTAWGFSNQRRKDLSRLWYRAASQSLDLAASVQQPGICTVQAVQVLFMSAKSLGYLEKQMHLFGVAHKTALDLGYEQLPYEATLDMLTPPPSFEQLVSEEPVTNQMIWTQLCLQEWLATRAIDILTTNRLLRTNESTHATGDYILPGHAISIQVNPQLSTILDTDFCIFLDRVAQIAAGHFESSCNMPEESSSYIDVLDLDQKLRVLSKDPIYQTQKPPRIVLSHLLLLLHKRWFLRSFEDSQFSYSRWASVTAATQIIRDIDTAREGKGEVSLWNFLSTVFAALVTMCQNIAHLSLMEAAYCEHREMIDRGVAALQGSCYGDLSREIPTPRRDHNSVVGEHHTPIFSLQVPFELLPGKPSDQINNPSIPNKMPAPALLNLPINRTGYGLMGLTWTPTPPSTTSAIQAMKAALNHGANFWNGGIIYGTPTSNSLHLLRSYFEQHPEDASKVVLSIKGGINPATHRPDSSEAFITQEIDAALSILDGKKCLDIYETARIDPTTPIETVMHTLLSLKSANKINGIGLSEPSASTIHRAASVGKIDVVEVEVSLWSTDIFTNGVAQACAEHGIVVAAYSPLGKGFLTGKMVRPEELKDGDHRKGMPRFQPGVFESNYKLVEGVKGIAGRKGVQAGQVALAWVRAQSGRGGNPVIVPIPGSTSFERIGENMVEVELTEDELKELDKLVKEHAITGGRYPEHFEKLCFGDSITLEEWSKKE